MEKQSVGNLADKIAKILNTAPSSFDPEDESVDATHAQVVLDDEEFLEDENIFSKFRGENIDLLADVDGKYAGKRANRKSLRDSDSDNESFSENDQSDHQQDDVGRSEKKDGSFESDGSNIEPLGSQDSSDEAQTEFSEDQDNESRGEVFDHSNTSFKHINEINISNQVKKGICVRNQVAIWENLLELRIQLQKCLIGANKMPQCSTFTAVKQESGPEFTKKVNDVKKSICGTLDKLLLLQAVLLQQYPETKNLDKGTAVESFGDSNQEIPSDSDNEEVDKKTDEIAVPQLKQKKRKLEEYEKQVDEQHTKYREYRSNVIQKWNNKTKVVLKGGATSYSVLDQIEYNLSNKERLVKRTQLKRSNYAIMGQDRENVGAAEECNPEIFDDDDFYHQLLGELIEVKSTDITDPVQLGRQWIQLQSLRSKMTRKIDTRATKGRKIRYAVHSKLVNFMAPIDENRWTEEAKNELYNSLFGKNQFAINS